MVEDFKQSFPSIKIKSLLADALYGDGNFIDQTEKLLNCSQIISKLRNNQLVFSQKTITVQAARLLVKAHGKKRFVVVIKYENEARI